MNINSSKKLRVSYHIEKTQKIRNRENELLLRTISPHHAVFTQSVSRCLVQVLILAGIYFDHYKPFNKGSISIQGLGSKRTDKGNTEKRMLVYKFYLSKMLPKKIIKWLYLLSFEQGVLPRKRHFTKWNEELRRGREQHCSFFRFY